MKILMTTVLPQIETRVDPRFGRAAFFLLVDTEKLEWQAVANGGADASGGAGVQAAQFAVDQKCEAVISGDFGPHAYEVLKAAGIEMYRFGDCQTAIEVVQRFREGQLTPAGEPGPVKHQH